jgi:beta-1,4-mannosyltransferase
MARVGDTSIDPARRVRVMQSFGAPRPTTNPYIHMLDAALAEAPGVEHLRFDRRRALLGRYDAIHFHWPETLLGGSTRLKAWARRVYARALLTRLRLTNVAVIRTVHNVELPKDVTRAERRMLEGIERRTDYRILLNEQTRVDGASTVIPHGHFRDWFARDADTTPDPQTIGFVGLVRRYKGVEGLIQAFGATRTGHPHWRLRIAGNPSSAELADQLRTLAAGDERIAFDLRFLAEDDFAAAIARVRGLVLPYRFMHNSGVVLAALSLGRPVLVPQNEVNAALADEVGPGWVHMFAGELDARDLESFMAAVAGDPPAAPDLSARDWTRTGMLHAAAYADAVAGRRTRAPERVR